MSSSLTLTLRLPSLLLIITFLAGCFMSEEPWLDLRNATTPLPPGRYRSEADQDHKVINVDQLSNRYSLIMPIGPESSRFPPTRFDSVYLVKIPNTDSLYALFTKMPNAVAAFSPDLSGQWVSVVTWVSPEGLICLDENYVGVHAPNGVLNSRPSGQFSLSIAAPEQLVVWIGENQAEVEASIKKNAKGCFHKI